MPSADCGAAARPYIVGRHDLVDLAEYGQGIATIGNRPLFVEQGYPNNASAHLANSYASNYTVDGHTVLTEADAGGNIIYRVHGFLAKPQELTQFQTVSYGPAGSTTVITIPLWRSLLRPPLIRPALWWFRRMTA